MNIRRQSIGAAIAPTPNMQNKDMPNRTEHFATGRIGSRTDTRERFRQATWPEALTIIMYQPALSCFEAVTSDCMSVSIAERETCNPKSRGPT